MPQTRLSSGPFPRKPLVRGLACLVAALGIAQAPVRAEDASPADATGVRGTIADAPGDDDPTRQLQSVQSDLTRSDAQRRKLEADIEEARTDRVRFNAALIETTARVRDAEAQVADTKSRLDALNERQDAIRRSLESRRALIGDVLASLQRMGRRPPPVLLVRPEDILKTIRTAILLGAVLPEMRQEAQTLAADLTELARVRDSITKERDALTAQVSDLNAEGGRLRDLIEARQKAQLAAEADLEAEKSRASELARQATSLKDLIGRLEATVPAARRAADAAKAADEAQRQAAQAGSQDIARKVAAGIFRDPARLQPAVPFAETRGLLPLPINGRILKTFGQPDGYGGTEKGLSIAARAKGIVTAPADGWVAFSGPYRTYGQVLILNLGGGYYNVLAGMDRVDVALGQFVLSGEPVGVMGDGAVRTAAAFALGASEPVLYVELRKDGAAIDPGPWWAKAAVEKVRG